MLVPSNCSINSRAGEGASRPSLPWLWVDLLKLDLMRSNWMPVTCQIPNLFPNDVHEDLRNDSTLLC